MSMCTKNDPQIVEKWPKIVNNWYFQIWTKNRPKMVRYEPEGLWANTRRTSRNYRFMAKKSGSTQEIRPEVSMSDDCLRFRRGFSWAVLVSMGFGQPNRPPKNKCSAFGG